MVEYNIESFFPSYEYIVENAYMYAWECDIFLQLKSGYQYEIEKKISRSDFKADFKKKAKHFQLENHKKEILPIPGRKQLVSLNEEQYNKFEYDISELVEKKNSLYSGDYYLTYLYNYFTARKNILPNRFFYLTPEGLLNKNEIPSYAGLLEYEEGEIKKIKPAPFLHKNKYNFDKILLDKYKFRNINLKLKVNSLRRSLEKFNNIYDDPNTNYHQEELNF